MNAIVGFSGRQFIVRKGSRFAINRVDGNVGDTIHPDAVYLMVDGDNHTSKPAPSTVSAVILGHVQGEKKVVFKHSRRKGYRRKRGDRALLTEIQIESISDTESVAAKKPSAPKATKKASASN